MNNTDYCRLNSKQLIRGKLQMFGSSGHSNQNGTPCDSRVNCSPMSAPNDSGEISLWSRNAAILFSIRLVRDTNFTVLCHPMSSSKSNFSTSSHAQLNLPTSLSNPKDDGLQVGLCVCACVCVAGQMCRFASSIDLAANSGLDCNKLRTSSIISSVSSGHNSDQAMFCRFYHPWLTSWLTDGLAHFSHSHANEFGLYRPHCARSCVIGWKVAFVHGKWVHYAEPYTHAHERTQAYKCKHTTNMS